jgi:hypothetical protein
LLTTITLVVGPTSIALANGAADPNNNNDATPAAASDNRLGRPRRAVERHAVDRHAVDRAE